MHRCGVSRGRATQVFAGQLRCRCMQRPRAGGARSLTAPQPATGRRGSGHPLRPRTLRFGDVLEGLFRLPSLQLVRGSPRRGFPGILRSILAQARGRERGGMLSGSARDRQRTWSIARSFAHRRVGAPRCSSAAVLTGGALPQAAAYGHRRLAGVLNPRPRGQGGGHRSRCLRGGF